VAPDATEQADVEALAFRTAAVVPAVLGASSWVRTLVADARVRTPERKNVALTVVV